MNNDKNISWMDGSMLFTKHMNAHVGSIQLAFTEKQKGTAREQNYINHSKAYGECG